MEELWKTQEEGGGKGEGGKKSFKSTTKGGKKKNLFWCCWWWLKEVELLYFFLPFFESVARMQLGGKRWVESRVARSSSNADVVHPTQNIA